MSATFIAHFMGKNITIFENVTKQAFIFEHNQEKEKVNLIFLTKKKIK